MDASLKNGHVIYYGVGFWHELERRDHPRYNPAVTLFKTEQEAIAYKGNSLYSIKKFNCRPGDIDKNRVIQGWHEANIRGTEYCYWDATVSKKRAGKQE